MTTKGTENEGKTFADVVDSILTNRARFFSFIGVILSFCALFLFVFWIVTKMIGATNATQINLSTTGAQILFETKTENRSEYLIIVHPQGWQKTDIPVRAGDRIEFKAGGSITVDVNGIAERTKKRHEFEDKYFKEKSLNKASEDQSMAPETYFNDEEREALRLRRGWVGPAGYEVDLTDQSFAARKPRRLLPKERLGALVGAIKEGKDKSPERSDAFLVGTEQTRTSEGNGELWFNVNDVLNDNDPKNIDLFYSDNVGFFWVKVTVEHRFR